MPAEALRPMTLSGSLSDLWKLVRQLATAVHATSVQEQEFSYAGALTVSTSTPWAAATDCRTIEVLALLGTAGSSSTVVEVDVNGSSIGTVTLGSGVTSNSAALSTALIANTDIVTVSVTTAGTGAEDLTVLLRVA
jgi:hypothetical protein